ncbi:hypothetical protein, partial [Bradyrhizobium liaoningense]|uniref:hypothetical protein n=1 Tax=Bradyrhizobium liaoningense TaxID=43992 RepID=UPI002010D88A
HGVSLSLRFWQARHPPRYAAYLIPSSPSFPHSSQIGGQAIFGANPSGRGARFTVRFTLNRLSESVAESAAPKSVLSDLDDQRMPASLSTRRMCPVCKHRMALARVSPGKRGFEERTFECSTCERTEVVSFAVDPMKTDAVGWLAGELRPPQ